jgi:hypothetical protein
MKLFFEFSGVGWCTHSYTNYCMGAMAEQHKKQLFMTRQLQVL